MYVNARHRASRYLEYVLQVFFLNISIVLSFNICAAAAVLSYNILLETLKLSGNLVIY